jgi:hypothetical protein
METDCALDKTHWADDEGRAAEKRPFRSHPSLHRHHWSMNETSPEGFTFLEGFTFALADIERPFADARALSHLLDDLRRSRHCSKTVCERIVKLFGGSERDPLAPALLSIAGEADVSGLTNGYHNPVHSLDVGVIWLTLALLSNRLAERAGSPPLSRRDLLIGCCAAFGHDIHHDGQGNEALGPDNAPVYVPFRLETRAADFVASRLRANGADADTIQTVRCAILITDVVHGYPVLETALAGATGAIHADAERAEFAALKRPTTRLIAATLRDADILQSAGLTARDHDRQTAALEIERGLPRHALGAEATEVFFEHILGGRFISPGGKRFQGSLDRLRELNRRRLSEPAWANLNLETVAHLCLSASAS